MQGQREREGNRNCMINYSRFPDRFSSFALGEGQDVTDEMTAPWRETSLPTILSHYDSHDIYNAGEFGLFYRELPTKSMHFKVEKCRGCKNSKIRLTGYTVANMCGEKILLFVIKKSKIFLRGSDALHIVIADTFLSTTCTFPAKFTCQNDWVGKKKTCIFLIDTFIYFNMKLII